MAMLGKAVSKMPELWVLQTIDDANYWVAVTMSIPLREIERYVENSLPAYKQHNRQKFYRAYCATDEEKENMSWQALPDFPEFSEWVVVGKEAKMSDGSTWKLS
jgi:hypothetical protein